MLNEKANVHFYTSGNVRQVDRTLHQCWLTRSFLKTLHSQRLRKKNGTCPGNISASNSISSSISCKNILCGLHTDVPWCYVRSWGLINGIIYSFLKIMSGKAVRFIKTRKDFYIPDWVIEGNCFVLVGTEITIIPHLLVHTWCSLWQLCVSIVHWSLASHLYW